MKQLIIIGEGQTEQSFCKDVLYDYFLGKEIIIHNPTIKKTKGGIVAWKVLKKEIENYLFSASDAFVTTLIDYYGITDKHGFPSWDESKKQLNTPKRVTFLEQAMQQEIAPSVKHRFTPYIQLFEFEALLFSDPQVFDRNFEKQEFLDYAYLQATLLLNPEEINGGTDTAPSKRLERTIKDYNKVVYGSLLAQDIGLEKMREKCPRFDNWIQTLEKI